jgi:hypothetical protein
MNEERGAALRLLYQLKLAIQKDKPELFGNQASLAQKTMTNLEKQAVDKKLQDAVSLKYTLPQTSKLTTINKSKKLEPIEKNMLKYEYTMKQ